MAVIGRTLTTEICARPSRNWRFRSPLIYQIAHDDRSISLWLSMQYDRFHRFWPAATFRSPLCSASSDSPFQCDPAGDVTNQRFGGRAILPRSFASGCHPVAPEAVVGPSKVADGKVKASLETGPPTPHPSSMYGSPDGYRRLWVRARSNTVRPSLVRRPSCFRIPPRRGRHYLLAPLISSASRFEAMRSGKSGRFRNKTAPI